MSKIKLTTEEKKSRRRERNRQYYLNNIEKRKEYLLRRRLKNKKKTDVIPKNDVTPLEPIALTKGELIALERTETRLKAIPLEDKIYMRV